MEHRDKFQGVICCCLDYDRTVKNTIHKLFDLKSPSSEDQTIRCFNLELNNKYYQATIQFIDYSDLMSEDDKIFQHRDILEDCHAIILYGNSLKLTTDQLDRVIEELSEVGGEPRILLYDGCDTNGSLQDWCIKNGYDLIDACDEAASKQLIDSLSAYKWTHRSDQSENSTDKPQLNDELMKKLADFDNLLGKLSTYRDRPELRGKPDDKNIVEIAGLLSNLLGDDLDDFLEADEGSNDNNKPADSSPAGIERSFPR